MTNLTIIATVLVASLTVIAVPSIRAQNGTAASRVKVPFAFEVGDKHFEPGVYTLEMLTTHILAVRGFKTGVNAMVDYAQGTVPADKGRVAFNKVGEQYFLSAVWTPGAADHLRCVQSNSERKAIRTLEAGNRGPVVPVAVALLGKP